MPLTVVLEGPDGAGKTTLAKALQARYGSGYQHAGPPFEGATPASLTRYYAAMVAGFTMPAYPIPAAAMEVLREDEALRQKFVDALGADQKARGGVRLATGASVVDRWALGETIYGPLFRGGSLVKPPQWRALVGLLDVLEIPLVVCLPPRAVCLANWQARVEQERFKDRAQVLKVYDAYASWSYGGRPDLARPARTWVYNYEDRDAVLLDFLDAVAERQR